MKYVRHSGGLLVLALLTALLAAGCSSSVRFADGSSPTTRKKQGHAKPKTESHRCINTKAEQNEADTQEETDYFAELERLANCKKNEYTTNIGLLREAKSWMGTKYVYGGESKVSGTDCSGFTQSVFASAGISLPRTAASQFRYTRRISRNEAEIGDLVFFRNKGKIAHVGFYAGKGMMIHASQSNGVVLEKIDKPCYINIAGYGRVPKLITVR